MYLSCEILTARYTIIQIRLNDTKHGEMYQEACSLAHSVDVNSSKPQFVGRQQHRSNAHDQEDTGVTFPMLLMFIRNLIQSSPSMS